MTAPADLPVLACACGAPLRWTDMRRPRHLRPPEPGQAPRVEPIVCADCARRPR